MGQGTRLLVHKSQITNHASLTYPKVDLCILYIFSLQACASHMKKAEEAVTKRACQLLTESRASRMSLSSSAHLEPFRVLSIGCGDGTFDAKILQAMINEYPDTKIHYTGIDIDKEVCEKAVEELGALKASDEVEIKMIAMDFEEIDSIKDEILPCDLVLAVHVLYYLKDFRKALTNAQVLTKADYGKCYNLHTDFKVCIH